MRRSAVGQASRCLARDYDTRDRTCVRDYIHVPDLADAHVRFLQYLLGGGETIELNLGTGTGTTVKELLAAIAEISGRPSPVKYTGRRDGDSSTLVADNRKAKEVLGWEPRYTERYYSLCLGLAHQSQPLTQRVALSDLGQLGRASRMRNKIDSGGTQRPAMNLIPSKYEIR